MLKEKGVFVPAWNLLVRLGVEEEDGCVQHFHVGKQPLDQLIAELHLSVSFLTQLVRLVQLCLNGLLGPILELKPVVTVRTVLLYNLVGNFLWLFQLSDWLLLFFVFSWRIFFVTWLNSGLGCLLLNPGFLVRLFLIHLI